MSQVTPMNRAASASVSVRLKATFSPTRVARGVRWGKMGEGIGLTFSGRKSGAYNTFVTANPSPDASIASRLPSTTTSPASFTCSSTSASAGKSAVFVPSTSSRNCCKRSSVSPVK